MRVRVWMCQAQTDFWFGADFFIETGTCTPWPDDANDFQRRDERATALAKDCQFSKVCSVLLGECQDSLLGGSRQVDARPSPATPTEDMARRKFLPVPRHDSVALVLQSALFSSPVGLRPQLIKRGCFPGCRDELVRAIHSVIGVISECNIPGAYASWISLEKVSVTDWWWRQETLLVVWQSKRSWLRILHDAFAQLRWSLGPQTVIGSSNNNDEVPCFWPSIWRTLSTRWTGPAWSPDSGARISRYCDWQLRPVGTSQRIPLWPPATAQPPSAIAFGTLQGHERSWRGLSWSPRTQLRALGSTRSATHTRGTRWWSRPSLWTHVPRGGACGGDHCNNTKITPTW